MAPPSIPETKQAQHLLVFGASGAIGGSVVEAAALRGWKITTAGRKVSSSSSSDVLSIASDPLSPGYDPHELVAGGPYTAVCWAQGTNTNDSVYSFDLATHRALYEANCTYILITLQALLQGGALAPASKLCVISSIWQNLARQSKLSYCMSKAALQGLVLSGAADLARDGHLINAVLPGALETPMTRKNLTSEQINSLTGATLHHRLASLTDVASLVCYLCSPENTGITGQFIAADLGFSHVRIV